MPQPPNILYLHSHDTGRFIQPYGHPVPTPHLQRFAEQGMLFRQAHCIHPTCSPARACLLTGQCAHENGMIGLAHLGFALKDPRRHLAWTLRGAGYQTVLCGTSHLTNQYARRKELLGYDRQLVDEHPKGSSYDACAAAFFAEKPQQPWFMACGFSETHRPFPDEPDENPDYVIPPPYLPDCPETRRDMACYKASARILDRKMGHVIETLDASGQGENTLVIITTDHGIAFPRMKCHLYDHGTGVMLMLRGPGGFSGGRMSENMVTHMDIYPTVCELAGITPPAWLEGKSLTPLAADPRATLHDAIFTEVNYHVSYDPQRAVRTRRYKYIQRFDARSREVLPNVDDSPSKDHWLQVGYPGVVSDALYDLEHDPNEADNRAADPACAGVLAELRNRLRDWMVRTHDPLLQGSVPAPEGAILVSPDGLSPSELKLT